jgi:2-oxoglutarate ferredoxin oxidoreductase subunit gamma
MELEGIKGSYIKKRRYELVVAGLGGQGVLLITQILVMAGMKEFPYVSWFPSYATFVRGGDCEGTAILSDEPIHSPLIYKPKSIILMNPSIIKAFSDRVSRDCLLILDSSLIPVWSGRKDVELVMVPATEMATNLGSRQSANFILLGAYLKRTEAVELRVVEETLRERMIQENKGAYLAKNLEAVRWGYKNS